MRFTRAQYEKAIANLRDGMEQLASDGRCCSICHDTGHQAWECGHNPLFAMACCEDVADNAERLHARAHSIDEAANDRNVDVDKAEWCASVHSLLHAFCGACSYMGVQTGPAKVALPSSIDDTATGIGFTRARDGGGSKLEPRRKKKPSPKTQPRRGAR